MSKIRRFRRRSCEQRPSHEKKSVEYTILWMNYDSFNDFRQIHNSESHVDGDERVRVSFLWKKKLYWWNQSAELRINCKFNEWSYSFPHALIIRWHSNIGTWNRQRWVKNVPTPPHKLTTHISHAHHTFFVLLFVTWPLISLVLLFITRKEQTENGQVDEWLFHVHHLLPFALWALSADELHISPCER